jgi:hypothetical protein
MRLFLYYSISSSYWITAAPYTYHLFSVIMILCSSIQVTFSRFVLCPRTGLLSLPKRVIYRVRSSASSFSLQTGKFTLLRLLYLWRCESICCHETSVTNYQSTLRKMAEERRSKPEIMQVMLWWLSSYCASHCHYVKYKGQPKHSLIFIIGSSATCFDTSKDHHQGLA